MPEFYLHLNPVPFEEAVHRTETLTEDLRAKGYIRSANAESRQQRANLRAESEATKECAE